MRIKSYFDHTVENAMAMARQELGPEAMLVSSRKAPPEARHLGDYEVVFASDAPLAEASSEAVAGLLGQPSTGGGEMFSLEVSGLKRELESMRRVLVRSSMQPTQILGTSAAFSEAFLGLTANDVAPDLAREIVQAAEERAASSGSIKYPVRVDNAVLLQALASEIEARFTAEPSIGRAEATQKIVALVGPPGSGKTTSLVKLAVNYGLASRRPALLLSIDTYRIAAADQLRSYAAILGIGFQVLETVTALSQAIEEHRGKEYIFIDTPGLGADDMESGAGLARFLSTRPDIDTHLVLSSSTKSADLTRMVDRFEVFRPDHLLFTKFDETGSFGPILNEAARTRKPLSFFATGQRIPEDLEAATRKRLVQLVLTGQGDTVRSAA